MQKIIIIVSVLAMLLLREECHGQSGSNRYTAGINYTVGVPTFVPNGNVSKVAIDTGTMKWYEYATPGGWRWSGDRVQDISGCAAPAYTPGKAQSRLVLNSCTEAQNGHGPELYKYTGSAWLCLNCGGNYTAGDGIDITGTEITNTAPDQVVSITGAGINAVTGTYPNFTVIGTEVDGSTTNELQTLSVNGSNITLSDGGGTVSVMPQNIIDSLGLWTLSENMKTISPAILDAFAGSKNANIVLLGDSKTDQSIIMERSFKQVLGEKFFFSGPGFIPINNFIDQFTGSIATWTLKTMLTGGAGPNMFSAQSGPSSTAINLFPYFASKSYYKFNRVKVLYVGKTGGGTFTLNVNGFTTSVNTSSTTGIQTAFVDAATISNHTVTVTQTAYNTSGVEIIGFIFENTTQAGLRVHKVGQTNATTTNYIGQDSASFVNQLKLLSPDVYFVWLGTNDKTQSIPPSTYKSNIKGIVRRLKATNGIADICLLGVGPKSVPPWTDGASSYEQYNNILKEVAKEDTISFFNTLKLEGIYSEANQRGLFQSDGIHEDTLGGILIANYILNSIPVISGAKQSDLLLVTKDSPVQHPQVFSYFDFGSRRTSSTETDFFVEGHTAPNLPNASFMKQFIGRNNTNYNGFVTIFEYIASANSLNSYSIKSVGGNLGIKLTAAGNFTADASITGTRLNFNGGLSNVAGLWNGTGTVRFAAASGDFNSLFLGRNAGPNSDAAFSGTGDVVVGPFAGSSLTTGSRNVIIGKNNSEYTTTSSGFISIGDNANRLTQNIGYNYSKSIVIGDSACYSPSYNPANKLVLENSPSNTPLLSGDFLTNKVGINVLQSAPRTTLDIRGTDAITIPSGTTAQRITGAVGDIRVNTTTGRFEGVRTGTGYENFVTTGIAYAIMREEIFTATAAQTSFTITYTAPAISGTNVPIRVYRNGVRLSYVATGPTSTQFTYSGATVTTSVSTAGDVITVEYFN